MVVTKPKSATEEAIKFLEQISTPEFRNEFDKRLQAEWDEFLKELESGKKCCGKCKETKKEDNDIDFDIVEDMLYNKYGDAVMDYVFENMERILDANDQAYQECMEILVKYSFPNEYKAKNPETAVNTKVNTTETNPYKGYDWASNGTTCFTKE